MTPVVTLCQALEFNHAGYEEYRAMVVRKSVCTHCLLKHDCMERQENQDLGCGEYIGD